MATYTEIQNYVKRRFGFEPKTCWITHTKELNGLPTRQAWNRAGKKRIVPCPQARRTAIEAALRHYRMI
jgi:hypothetical protein